jgi:hypothetical protein
MIQLLNYTNIRMIEGMKSVSEQNAEATKRMAELAEVNRQQAAQSARQAQSMAVIAYDTKRDSEVMKAVTLVTLIFLPATFVAVSPIVRQKFIAYPVFLFQTVFSMGFLNFEESQVALSRQGRIYLAFTFPLTCVVLGVSFAWIIWTGKKVEKPTDYATGQVLAQAADTLRLGAGPSKQGV